MFIKGAEIVPYLGSDAEAMLRITVGEDEWPHIFGWLGKKVKIVLDEEIEQPEQPEQPVLKRDVRNVIQQLEV